MNQRYTHALAIAGILLATMILSQGCIPFFSDKDKEEASSDLGMISIHAYYPQGSTDEKTMVLYHVSGRPVHVGVPPLITSTLMEQIDIVPTTDGNSLKIRLSTRGRNLWAEATSRYFGRHMALVVDETFRALIHVPKASDTGVFMISGPFSDAEAQRMADYVNKREDDGWL